MNEKGALLSWLYCVNLSAAASRAVTGITVYCPARGQRRGACASCARLAPTKSRPPSHDRKLFVRSPQWTPTARARRRRARGVVSSSGRFVSYAEGAVTPPTLSFDFDLTRRLSPSGNNIIKTPAPPKAKRAGMRTQTRPLARSNSFSERGDPGCGSICTLTESTQSSTGCAHRAPGGVGYILNPLAAHLTPCTSTQVMAPRPIRSDVR